RLESSLGEERSSLFLVSRSSLQTFTLPPRAEIEARARRLYDLLSSRAPDSRDETPQQRQARIAEADAELPRQEAELSRMILGPAAEQLGEKRLLIVAQGALQLIPFAALPEPESGRAKERGSKRAGEKEQFFFSLTLSLPRSPALPLSRSPAPFHPAARQTRNHQPAVGLDAGRVAARDGQTPARAENPRDPGRSDL